MDIQEMVSDITSTLNFGYSIGILNNLNQSDWEKAAEILETSRLKMPVKSGSFDQEHLWFLPLITILIKTEINIKMLIDIGCGLSVPMWFINNMYNNVDLFGLDMEPCDKNLYPEMSNIIKCQLLDPNSIRLSIPTIETNECLLICTELLEHLQYNPMTMFTILCERIKPDYVYFTVPTFTNSNLFMKSDWVHYSDLPEYQHQPIRYSPWHYKGWNFSELADLVNDLGYDVDSGYSGYYRCGIFGLKKCFVNRERENP